MNLYDSVTWYAQMKFQCLEIPKWPPLPWNQGKRLLLTLMETTLKLLFLKEYNTKPITTSWVRSNY